ncbi:MAG TPA: alpha/beta hydrolase [Burkholderiaceae bacterium]|nr:alpha/beta hydrolase [Burkholderiaceae bacterium]
MTVEPTLHHVSCPDWGGQPPEGKSAGQHRVAYWQWGDAGAGHVIVCAHGLSRQGRDFDALARFLLKSAGAEPLRVICPDVAGRGQSDWLADPLGYQIPYYVADMLRLLGTLGASGPITALDWVGTSMGGLIGLGLAGQPGLPLPVPLRRLVLNDVGPTVQWEALERIGQYLGKSVDVPSLEEGARALLLISQGFGPHTADQWLALSAPMFKPREGGGLRLHYDPRIAVPMRHLTREAAAQGEAALWALYDQIAARTLLIRGAESDLLSSATAEAMAARGPRPRIVEFAGVGHAPMFIAPDQAAVVADFLLRA